MSNDVRFLGNIKVDGDISFGYNGETKQLSNIYAELSARTQREIVTELPPIDEANEHTIYMVAEESKEIPVVTLEGREVQKSEAAENIWGFADNSNSGARVYYFFATTGQEYKLAWGDAAIDSLKVCFLPMQDAVLMGAGMQDWSGKGFSIDPIIADDNRSAIIAISQPSDETAAICYSFFDSADYCMTVFNTVIQNNNQYAEYICILKDGFYRWEKIGDTNVDLTAYDLTSVAIERERTVLRDAKNYTEGRLNLSSATTVSEAIGEAEESAVSRSNSYTNSEIERLEAEGFVATQADWNSTDDTDMAYIKNKPLALLLPNYDTVAENSILRIVNGVPTWVATPWAEDQSI